MPTSLEYTVFAIHENQELVRPVMAFHSVVALFDAAHEPAGQHVLTIGREVVVHD